MKKIIIVTLCLYLIIPGYAQNLAIDSLFKNIDNTNVSESTVNSAINLPYDIVVNNLNKDKFIERIIDIFPKLKPLNIKSLNSDSINGVFYFPEHNLNKNVLSDLIMNNPLFSSILSINESVKATKSRVSIYVYFNHINTGPITATITEKTMTRNDPNMKDKDFKVSVDKN